MASSIAIAAVASGVIGGGALVANSVGSSPETLPAGCSYSVEVEKGDSWYGIATQYGMTAEELAAVNDTSIEEVPHPGDLICTIIGEPGVSESVSIDYSQQSFTRDGSACSPNTETYTIQAGEGPYNAANAFGFPLDTVYDMNPGLKDATVYAGDIICSIIDVGELDADATSADAQTFTVIDADPCRVSADVNGDGDRVIDDKDDIRAFQEAYNAVMSPDIEVDGKRGSQTNNAIRELQETVGTKVDCDWGDGSEYKYDLFQDSKKTSTNASVSVDDGVRDGCEPYHQSTEIVICASLGQGDEPVEVYQRGDDGNMYLTNAAYGRSSRRIDREGDCITPRDHVVLDKSSMQVETESGLQYYMPFGSCGGDGGTGLHFYPNLGQSDDSSGCIRTPYTFIEDTFNLVEDGGQTEIIVRDK